MSKRKNDCTGPDLVEESRAARVAENSRPARTPEQGQAAQTAAMRFLVAAFGGHSVTIIKHKLGGERRVGYCLDGDTADMALLVKAIDEAGAEPASGDEFEDASIDEAIDASLQLSCDDQYAIAARLCANLGYTMQPEILQPDTPDAERVTAALDLAAGRLDLAAADHDEGTTAFHRVSEWAHEARAALRKGGE